MTANMAEIIKRIGFCDGEGGAQDAGAGVAVWAICAERRHE
jgi:hypothetical protein